MDTKDLTGSHPELLPYLCNDLLPGLDELLDYAEQLRINPETQYGLTSRIMAMRDDLAEALGERFGDIGERSKFTVYHYGKVLQPGTEGMANDV
jgi:hypothetical protein